MNGDCGALMPPSPEWYQQPPLTISQRSNDRVCVRFFARGFRFRFHCSYVSILFQFSGGKMNCRALIVGLCSHCWSRSWKRPWLSTIRANNIYLSSENKGRLWILCHVTRRHCHIMNNVDSAWASRTYNANTHNHISTAILHTYSSVYSAAASYTIQIQQPACNFCVSFLYNNICLFFAFVFLLFLNIYSIDVYMF